MLTGAGVAEQLLVRSPESPDGVFVKSPTVLVLSDDQVAAAMIGALAETLGYVSRFPLPGETPRDALRRLKPRLVLVDCEHDSACSEAFFGPARMMGAQVVLIGSNRSEAQLGNVAERFSLTALRLPADAATVERVLGAARSDG